MFIVNSGQDNFDHRINRRSDTSISFTSANFVISQVLQQNEKKKQKNNKNHLLLFKTTTKHFDLNNTKYEKKCNNHFSQLICCGSSTSNGCETSRILQNFLLHLALHLQSDQEMEQDQLLQSSSRPKGLVQPNTNPHQNQHFFKIFHHFQDYFIMNFWHFRIT